MSKPLSDLSENKIRERIQKRMREVTNNTSSEFFVYVLDCNPQIQFRRELVGMDGEKIVTAVQDGEDAWLKLPSKIRPPIGDHESNFPKWIAQAVEADEVYYIGQTRSPTDRIVEHAVAGPDSANATRLFAPQDIVHIEPARSYEDANALEDLISEVITFGCEIQSQNYLDYGTVPEDFPSELSRFVNPKGPDIEIENGRNIRTFHAAPNNYWTTNMLFHLTKLPNRIVGWNAIEEIDGYPIDEGMVVDYLLTSLELTAETVASFEYERIILLNCIESLESWFESSDEYPERVDPEEGQWDMDEGIESTEEGKQYFQEIHDIAKDRIIKEFLSEFRRKTRELHPEPLRFAYADKTPNLEVESLGEDENNKYRFSKSADDNTDSSLSPDNLTDTELSRLKDVIKFAPTTNGKLQREWGLEESADVHHYLENHLSQWYYRDSDSRIRAVEDAKEGI